MANKVFEKPKLQGYVVLGKTPSDNAYKAVIELSFGMDLSGDRANFFWSGTGYDNFFGAKHEIDGFADAERYRDHFAKGYSDMEFQVFDVHSDDLPIVIDWDEWREAGEPSDKTLSGVKDKYRRRNPKFYMREDS